MRTASIFVIFILLSVELIAGNLVQEQQYWTATGLRMNFLTANILNENTCGHSAELLYGCVKAIDALLVVPDSNDATFFTTTTWLSQLQQFARDDKSGSTYSVLKDFGFYKIVKATAGPVTQVSDNDAIAEIMKDKAREKQEIAQWRQVFSSIPTSTFALLRLEWSRSPSNPIIPFSDLISWITTNRITAANEAMSVGDAWNEFLVNGVDAHAWTMPKAEYDALSAGTNDDFSGIGASIHTSQGKVIVASPMEDGPAFNAGIRANDVIVSVDGTNVTGMDLNKVTDLLKGNAGTQVTLRIQRKTQSLTVTLTRAKIHQDNVTNKLLSTVDAQTGISHRVGYLKIHAFLALEPELQNPPKDPDLFPHALCDTVKTQIDMLQAQGIEALILDLRDNGGGDLNEARCIAGLFIGKGKKVVEQRTLNEREFGPTQEIMSSVDKDVNEPVVTLVNAGSASASEILSGVLQDYQVGPIVGARTWGKASVQAVGQSEQFPTIIQAQTIARFYLPGNATRPEHTNQIVGIIPDVEAYAVPNPTELDKYAYREADLSPIVLSQQDPVAALAYPQMTAAYQQCIAQHGVAKKVYADSQDAQIAPDYQKLVGLDAALCSVDKSIQVLTAAR